MKNLAHFGQTYYEDAFQVFKDSYSLRKKRKGLNQKTEEIPLKDIRMPTALFIGDNDEFTSPETMQWLRDELGENVIHYEVVHSNHNGMLIGRNMFYF